jgi:hypothetical protein
MMMKPSQKHLRAAAWIALAVGMLSPSSGAQAADSDLPVRQVVLYKHGVAYFERQGTAPAGAEIRLDFRDGDMNDVLKSLTVSDLNGGKISGIRYDSNESLEERLSKYPFAIPDQVMLSAFLDSVKGAAVELKTDRTIRGTIVSARAIQGGPGNDRTTLREQVTLLSESDEVLNLDLATISSIRLVDPKLEDQLKQYLHTVAQARSKDKRSIYIDSATGGARELRVEYICPTAVWKSSYRLALGDAMSTLEGWAIVDNTTDDDWKDVKLSVVSGRPISFISQLDTPRYGNRQVAELPEDKAAGPVVYGGAVQQQNEVALGNYYSAKRAKAPAQVPAVSQSVMVESGAAGVGSGSGRGYGAGAGGGMGGGVYRPGFALSGVAGATGATLGELFEYRFAGPVTIKKNESAMLPFLQDKVAARRLLIYQEGGSEHPVNAAELTNKTGKTLDGGPITVYDGGAYAGEALFETLTDGDKRLIGYAVDYGTRITTKFGSGQQTTREIHANNGLITIHYANVEKRIYTVKNVDAKPKTLIIEQPARDGYNVVSPKPLERTAAASRFEVKLESNGQGTLEVQSEYPTFDSITIQSANTDVLATVVQNKALTATGQQQLQKILDTKRQLEQIDADLAAVAAEVTDLSNDQARWRQNIDSLRGVPGQEEQVRKYAGELAESDVTLVKLRDRQHQLEQKKKELEQGLRDQFQRLDF